MYKSWQKVSKNILINLTKLYKFPSWWDFILVTLSIWNNLIRLQLLQMLQTERKKDIKIVERISQKVCLHKFVNIGLPEHSQKKMGYLS